MLRPKVLKDCRLSACDFSLKFIYVANNIQTIHVIYIFIKMNNIAICLRIRNRTTLYLLLYLSKVQKKERYTVCDFTSEMYQCQSIEESKQVFRLTKGRNVYLVTWYEWHSTGLFIQEWGIVNCCRLSYK